MLQCFSHADCLRDKQPSSSSQLAAFIHNTPLSRFNETPSHRPRNANHKLRALALIDGARPSHDALDGQRIPHVPNHIRHLDAQHPKRGANNRLASPLGERRALPSVDVQQSVRVGLRVPVCKGGRAVDGIGAWLLRTVSELAIYLLGVEIPWCTHRSRGLPRRAS